MHKHLSALAALAVVAAVALPAPTMAQGRERTKVGTLTCDISGRHWLDHHVEKGSDLHVHAVSAGTA